MSSKVIEYVMTTPKNSNKAILKQLLNGMSESSSGDLVSLTIGKTITGEPGTAAKVENVGTATKPILQFTIPRGADGKDAVLIYASYTDIDNLFID